MVRALTGRGRVRAEDWGVVVVGGEWVGIVPAQALQEVAYVPVVERRFLTKQVFLAMI